VERSDAAAGTLEAMALAQVRSGTLLTHADEAAGRLSGFGVVRIDGDRAVLRAFVDPPDARREAEILGDLIRAMQVKRLFERGWLRIERVLRPETPGLHADTVAAYRQLGFEQLYTEREMVLDLRGAPPDGQTPGGVAIAPWTRERDAAIREAYNDAFRDRGFAGFDEDDWAGETFSAQDGFRADLSFLALDGAVLAGFCLCEGADEPDTGWIDTVGVRPAYRRRGVATALLARTMAAMRDAGLDRAALRVNEDNDGARRLYERLGFTVAKKHVVFRKQIS
jgi:mycothiol synthase